MTAIRKQALYLFVFQHFINFATDLRANPMMKDLEIAFTAKEVTAFGGVSLLYKMLDNLPSKGVHI